MNLLSTIGIVYHSDSIWEGRISSSIGVDDSFGSIWIANLLGTVKMMIFDLLVWEVVGLLAVLVRYLSGLNVRDEVMIV
jgi:hypothetical protein